MCCSEFQTRQRTRTQCSEGLPRGRVALRSTGRVGLTRTGPALQPFDCRRRPCATIASCHAARRANREAAPDSQSRSQALRTGFMSDPLLSVLENQPSPLPGVQPLKVVRRGCSRLRAYARHCLPGAKINQSEKSGRNAPAGRGAASVPCGIGATASEEERFLLATKAPPTPPQQWRARSKGMKQINMAICTGFDDTVVPTSALCSRATTIRPLFRTKREIRPSSQSSV